MESKQKIFGDISDEDLKFVQKKCNELQCKFTAAITTLFDEYDENYFRLGILSSILCTSSINILSTSMSIALTGRNKNERKKCINSLRLSIKFLFNETTGEEL